MNLANVVQFDIARRRYRIVPERAFEPNRRHGAAAPVEVREHHAGARKILERRSLRAGGREVMRLLYRARRFLGYSEIKQALPEVHPITLKTRLCIMNARGDIERHGERNHFRYGLPIGSTFACT